LSLTQAVCELTAQVRVLTAQAHARP